MQNKLVIGAALAGAALLGAIAVAYSNAQSSNSKFSPADEQKIRDIVHDYLMDNPEVLIDSLRAYDEQQRANADAASAQAARENLSALLNPKHGVIAGADPASASVAVIEFFDYHCAFCKRASGFVKDLTKSDPAVEVVFREFPILREESDYAAEFALASRAQGKYTDLHFAMLSENGIMTKERVRELATKLGIDDSLVDQELKKPVINEAISETHRIASEMAVSGTPTFVVASLNGKFVKVIQGNRQDDVKAAIADAKKAAKS